MRAVFGRNLTEGARPRPKKELRPKFRIARLPAEASWKDFGTAAPSHLPISSFVHNSRFVRLELPPVARNPSKTAGKVMPFQRPRRHEPAINRRPPPHPFKARARRHGKGVPRDGYQAQPQGPHNSPDERLGRSTSVPSKHSPSRKLWETSGVPLKVATPA
jgi:hypothetical protein